MDGKETFRGTLTVQQIGVEYTIIEIQPQPDDYVLVGYIDAFELQAGEEIELAFYVAVDGVNQRRVFLNSYRNIQDTPVIYIKPIIVPRDGLAKLTLRQTRGTPRSFPYWIAKLIPDIGIIKYLERQIA